MNISPYLIINGKSSREINGLLIQSLAPISKAPVKTKVETIDGRDGDIVTPLGFNAYDKPVSIGLTYNYDIDEVIEFFNSEGEVIFSNEPDKVYHFAIYNQIDFERLIRFKTAEVVFHVQPFKFSNTEQEQSFNVSDSPNTIKIRNAGNYYSTPTLKITASGTVSVSLNNTEILIIEFGETSQTIIIDADKMNAYDTSGNLLNRLVTGNYDNIKFKVGANTITTTGSVTKVEIDKYSRWI